MNTPNVRGPVLAIGTRVVYESTMSSGQHLQRMPAHGFPENACCVDGSRIFALRDRREGGRKTPVLGCCHRGVRDGFGCGFLYGSDLARQPTSQQSRNGLERHYDRVAEPSMMSSPGSD